MKVSETHIRVVHGAAEARALVASLFEPGPELPDHAYGISNVDVLEQYFPEYSFSSGNSARLAAGVPSRWIYTSSKGNVYSRSDHLLRRESRYLPLEQLDPIGDVTIVGETVVFMKEQAGSLVACAITSRSVAEQMLGMFNILWEQGR